MTDSVAAQLSLDTVLDTESLPAQEPVRTEAPPVQRPQASERPRKTAVVSSKTVATTSQLPPMLRHYLELKAEYPQHLLLYQVGDFYEVFFEDAKIAADALGIRLTSRNKDQPSPIPMCGVPIHALDNYLPRLLKLNFSCVIMSQVDDAQGKKSGVRREISRIVTPGVRFSGDGLE